MKIVVPTGPGSSRDLIVRLMGDKLAARWGQPVVVENKPGAGGMLGLDIVAKASDGHTLGIGFNGPLAFAPYLYRKTPYDPAKDLRPIVMTTSQPMCWRSTPRRCPPRRWPSWSRGARRKAAR